MTEGRKARNDWEEVIVVRDGLSDSDYTVKVG